jgi:hypothetical protein
MASETETETEVVVAVAAPKKQKKLKPARKQVKPGDVVKTEAPQTGKEYSKFSPHMSRKLTLTGNNRHLVQQMGGRRP